MHGYGGFAAARHPLNDDVVPGLNADDLVLILLDGGHDIPEYRIGILGEIGLQQLVAGYKIGVVIILQPPVGNAVGALEFQHAGIADALTDVLGVSQLGIIIEVCDGGAPVDDHGRSGLIVIQAAPADVQLPGGRAIFGKVHPTEVRTVLCPPAAADELPQPCFHVRGDYQLVVKLRVVGVITGEHVLYAPFQLPELCSGALCPGCSEVYDFLQLCFFVCFAFVVHVRLSFSA